MTLSITAFQALLYFHLQLRAALEAGGVPWDHPWKQPCKRVGAKTSLLFEFDDLSVWNNVLLFRYIEFVDAPERCIVWVS